MPFFYRHYFALRYLSCITFHWNFTFCSILPATLVLCPLVSVTAFDVLTLIHRQCARVYFIRIKKTHTFFFCSFDFRYDIFHCVIWLVNFAVTTPAHIFIHYFSLYFAIVHSAIGCVRNRIIATPARMCVVSSRTNAIFRSIRSVHIA